MPYILINLDVAICDFEMWAFQFSLSFISISQEETGSSVQSRQHSSARPSWRGFGWAVLCADGLPLWGRSGWGFLGVFGWLLNSSNSPPLPDSILLCFSSILSRIQSNSSR